ncbi:MAG: hypothetical protein UW37_C0014G0025 [Candidatus Gottesmanbacteria bacterium GW2011_GWA2_44_17]|uniref:DUF5666 domain-containing protein n=3 Tax=Candidatus Gottesmaniibacteriota TaxID=1752720 RepID=A0A0G1INP3_9BACT|nr:MAG: hypothetical protein UV63_C0020G0007 [Microgenomates group bacterium GW2011_GWC1_43_11]KKT38723.1 MAG: hypothetical protein UW22_C0007G0026 [Candidatus Gottesmanbacteria bacterium GW2011_GWB1_44_11c]KKT47043.1 MAG: hypothetical protein UW37_C0014G0025 [Candidatus Gottesmanbacteria bacterium GW2011_GWA2_44_17]KKT60563.1 MAG: hypothetical protein UW52_C0023G0006 [Candidatus Gottesmanbacteria bacterium GW2011_GWA1_44_24b]HCM82593.1 hypothetical protein [Patescibacteria group bacterium]
MRKTYVGIALSIGIALFITIPVYAVALPVQQVRKQIQEERKEIIQERIATLSGVNAWVRTRAALIKATVLGKGTNSFTVKGDNGKEYTVAFDGSTQWRRKFWGKSDFAEMSVNDVLNIHGKWTSEEMTEIQARLIRNISIQKRYGVFFGTVKSLSSGGWVMSTIKRHDQTVAVSGSTRFINRTGAWITQGAVLVGHRVRVRGLWDSINSTITEVTEVKDFDLPARPTATPKS